MPGDTVNRDVPQEWSVFLVNLSARGASEWTGSRNLLPETRQTRWVWQA